ncbi:MAG TPA: hypothetical protein VFU63_03525 [Ktedonobacterales bacterium]|nr:hypothetical protein [Ktedonobacterales bacterium]
MTDELDSYGNYDDFGQDVPQWGHIAADEQQVMRRHHLANPDDFPVSAPSGGRPRTIGPDYTGTPGFVAIVQGQVYLVAAILILQLFLITTALFELLSGRTDILWWLAGASLISFLITLLVALWPRRRVVGGVRSLRN